MDYPYAVLLLILLVLAYLEWIRPKSSNKYFRIACWIVFVFIAFRAPVVGADTWDYYRFATNVRNFYNHDTRELEILYQWYNSFFRTYCPIGLVFMTVNTIIVFAPIRYILKKYVKRKTFAVLVFFLIFEFSPFFVALRQILSLSLILWGVVYVQEKYKFKWFIFFLLLICAYFMHTTAVVVGALYLFAYFFPLFHRGLAFAAIIASAIVGVVLQSFDILAFFDLYLSMNFESTERVSGYFENEELNDLKSLNITLRASVVAIIAFSLIAKDKVNHWFSKIYLIGVILFNMFLAVPMIARMILANMLFVVVVLPWVFENMRSKSFRRMVNVIILLLVLYFSRSFIIINMNYDLSSEQRMHPYYFFFEDYHTHPSITKF